MSLLGLYTLAIVASGLMVGNELAVSAFVHPRLRVLDDRTHAAGAQALARIYGAVMPFWYATVLLLTVLTAATMRPAWSGRAWLAVASALLWFCAIVSPSSGQCASTTRSSAGTCGRSRPTGSRGGSNGTGFTPFACVSCSRPWSAWSSPV